MQSLASVGRAVARLSFRRGSPQRIQYSPRLTVSALLTLPLTAAAVHYLVFQGDLVLVCLYVFSILSGGYLGTALLSRRSPVLRLRTSLQAMALLLVCGHLLVLLTAPLRATPIPWLAAALAAVLVVSGMTGCVQFAAGVSRPRASLLSAAFVCTIVAFYATMHWLLAIALA
jgi:hypothetical protein